MDDTVVRFHGGHIDYMIFITVQIYRLFSFLFSASFPDLFFPIAKIVHLGGLVKIGCQEEAMCPSRHSDVMTFVDIRLEVFREVILPQLIAVQVFVDFLAPVIRNVGKQSGHPFQDGSSCVAVNAVQERLYLVFIVTKVQTIGFFLALGHDRGV